MAKISLYIPCSMDGYIAKSDGSTDFLALANAPNQDYGFADFLASVDTLLMGRKTYELLAQQAAWPYQKKKTFVLTHLNLKSTQDSVQFIKGNISKVLSQIEEAGAEHVWVVGGSQLIHMLMQAHRIDHYCINYLPVMLGQGLPLFEPPYPEEILFLKYAKRYDNSVLQVHYDRNTPEAYEAALDKRKDRH